MKRKMQVLIMGLCATFAWGVNGASAHSFYISDLNALTGKVVPEIDDNPGLYQEATPVQPPAYGEFAWDLGGTSNNALIILSTDHLTDDKFALDVWGSADFANWNEANLSGVYRSDDADDFATYWHFENGVRYLGVNSWGNLVISQSDEGLNGIASKAEIDGVARVFEPSSLLLACAGVLSTGLFWRKKKAL